MKPEHDECVAPERSSEELSALKGALAARSRVLRQTSDHFALFAGETRLKILVLLRHAGELCVCDLATVLGHVVKSRRDGMTIYYRLAESENRLFRDPIPELITLEKE
jgi:hypothetical protein